MIRSRKKERGEYVTVMRLTSVGGDSAGTSHTTFYTFQHAESGKWSMEAMAAW